MVEEYVGSERRHFKRLVVRLPVRFLFIDAEDKKELTETRSGHTVDISGGGLLLEMDELNEEWIKELISGMIRVGLELKVPTSSEPIRTLAKVAWMTKRKEPEEDQKKYLLGLNFVDITEKDRDKVLEYVVTAYLDKLQRDT